MYRIEIENNGVTEVLHDLNSDRVRRVASCEFTDDLYSVPSSTIVVYPQNPCYNNLHEMTTLVKIINTRTNEVVFDGHILQIPDHGMQESGTIAKKIICEGELGYLCDTVQLYHHYENTLTRAFLSALLDYHNSLVQSKNPERCILMGVCIPSTDNSKTTSYRSTFDEIKENVVSRLGGFIRMTRDGQGRNILNYYSETSYGTVSQTTVELSKNMKSISVNTDATGTITRLFPLGAQMNNETGERLTISSVNGGIPYLDDTEAIQETGVIKCGTYVWDDVTDAENLLTKGREYLAQASRVKKTFQATVLDLSTIGAEADTFKVGNTYRFVNRLIGLDEYLRINKITVNIYAPYQPTIEIGDKLERITSISAQVRRYVEYEIPQQASKILQQARDNATALITAATHGHVVVEPDEILIMNTASKTTATQMWRFNLNGWGHSHSEKAGDAYKGPFTLAATMDGAIVADFITAGSMYGDRIRGGTLVLGGSGTAGDESGVLSVLSSSNQEICRMDKNGADITGSLYNRNSDTGYWLRLENGAYFGGDLVNGEEEETARLSMNAVVYDGDHDITYKGLSVDADVISLGCEIFSVNGATGTTGFLNYVGDVSFTTSQIEVVTDASIDGNGQLQLTKQTIEYVSGWSWYKTGTYFKNGIMCTALEDWATGGASEHSSGVSTETGGTGGSHVYPPEPEEGTVSGVPPLAFYTTGTALNDYTISGASGGVGDLNTTSGKYVITVAVLNRNLYGYQVTSEEGGYLLEDGTIQTQSQNNYITSGFIPIPSGISQLTYSFYASGFTGVRAIAVCAYDSSKNFISAPIYEGATLNGNTRYSYPFDVPAGTAFIRASYITSRYNPAMRSPDYQMQLDVGTGATDYIIPRAEKHYITLDAPLYSGETYNYDGTVTVGTNINSWNFLFIETAVQPENVTIRYEVEGE